MSQFNPRRQLVDTKQVPYVRPVNIMCPNIKCCHPGDLMPFFVHPLFRHAKIREDGVWKRGVYVSHIVAQLRCRQIGK